MAAGSKGVITWANSTNYNVVVGKRVAMDGIITWQWAVRDQGCYNVSENWVAMKGL